MVNHTTGSDDTACEILVSPMPTPRPRPLDVQRVPRARRVLFVDSTKPNSDQILFRVRDKLTALGVTVDDLISKRRASQVMDTPQLDQLRDYEGLVVCAVND